MAEVFLTEEEALKTDVPEVRNRSGEICFG